MSRLTIRCIAVRSGFILISVLIIYSVYRLQRNPVGTLLRVNDLNDLVECTSSGSCTSNVATPLELSSVVSVSRLLSASSDAREPTPRAVRRLLKNSEKNHYDIDEVETDVSEHINHVTALSTSQEGTKELLNSRVLISDNVMVRRLNCSDSRDCSTPLLRADGVIRHCIGGKIIGKVSPDLKTSPVRLGKAKFAESAPGRRRSFKQVFDSRAWGHSWDAQFKGLNASGMGATLNWAQETIATLHAVVDQLKQRYGLLRVRLLDIPCGDMAWMSRFLMTRNDVDYTGVDIVPDLIRHHRDAFAGRPWKFVLSDVVHDGINSSDDSYDLVLCRTLLQHLYFPDVLRVLSHLSVFAHLADQPVYLLTTSFAAHPANEELVIDADNPGRFRRLNLEIPPISLSPPLCMTRDGPPDAYDGWNHFIGLWKLPLRRLSDCWKPTSVAVSEFPHKLFSCVDWSVSTEH